MEKLKVDLNNWIVIVSEAVKPWGPVNMITEMNKTDFKIPYDEANSIVVSEYLRLALLVFGIVTSIVNANVAPGLIAGGFYLGIGIYNNYQTVFIR